jgi:hypothetical protein
MINLLDEHLTFLELSKQKSPQRKHFGFIPIDNNYLILFGGISSQDSNKKHNTMILYDSNGLC